MKLNISCVDKNNCCGCKACLSVCPRNAIVFDTDDCGFAYPVIQDDKCVGCGLCLDVCKCSEEYKYPILECYAAKCVDKKIVLNSSSGGVMYSFFKQVIDNGGVVFAAAFNSELELVYQKANTIRECMPFHGSKYVQADSRDSFIAIEKALKDERQVLYVGTSCYVARLKAYLNMKKCSVENLITVDFICHGVPSPGIFKEYVEWINKNNEVETVMFRNKMKHSGEKLETPWKFGRYNCAILYKNGKREVNTLKSRVFLNLFTSNNCLRSNCYSCRYTCEEKPADITVSDFWGIEEAHPEFADNYGVSAIMVHTENGKCFLEGSSDLLVMNSCIEKISKKQGMLRSPAKKGEQYDDFWALYKKNGFISIAKKYGDYGIIGWLRNSKLYEIWSKIRYHE